jgi:hypothetical protein
MVTQLTKYLRMVDELKAENAQLRAALEEGYNRMEVKGWCPFCTMLEVDTFRGHEHDPDCRYKQALAASRENATQPPDPT